MWAWLIPLVLLPAWFEFSAWREGVALGFPLDDAWIHAQFARNLATGHGFTYTGSQWVAGSTAPAWTALLALGYFGFRSALLAAKILGLALYVLSAVLSARLVHHLTGDRGVALAAGLLLGSMPAMTWGAISGMEVSLATALVLGGFLVYLTRGEDVRREILAVALFSAGVLARPEALVVLGVVALHLVAGARGVRRCVLKAATVLALAVGLLGPVVVFDLWTTGRPLPTTFYAKSGPGLVRALADGDAHLIVTLLTGQGPDAVWRFGETLVEQLGMVAPLVGAGVLTAFFSCVRRRGGLLLASSVIIAVYAMGVVAPFRVKPENFRYTAQFLALAVTLGMAGLASWVSLIRWRALRITALSALVAGGVYASVSSAPAYVLAVRNINELHVNLAEWVRTHLPPGSRVAANDVGALAYFGGREVIDLEGLVSPESLAFSRAERGIGVAGRTRPDYLAIFPGWYPDIVARPDLFREVHRVSVAVNPVSAGSTIVVYNTPWTRQQPTPQASDKGRRRWPA